ncbi:MAG: hypothetical protein ISS29_02960 [Candidatus Marinimicrobia bacterium]|nr:hypothetical protein [Candidatus Neomarinimicrobiota bacterium]
MFPTVLYEVEIQPPGYDREGSHPVFKTGINTPFKALIQQIDVGLVRSFFVKLKFSDDTEEEAKMEFSIIELLDLKIILGVISKNNK